MKKTYPIAIITAMVMIFSISALAFDKPQYSNSFLLSVLFKVQGLREQAMEEIRKLDIEIKNNEATIQKSKQIIDLASQRTDAKAKQAEVIAREALLKAQEAKRKNEETRREWELKKIRADRSYAAVENMLSQDLGSNKSNNTENYTVHSSIDTYKSTNGLVIIHKKEEKNQLQPPPYLDPQIPPINCKEALKYLNRSDCYCEQPNLAPICGKNNNTLGEKEKTYAFYWQAEIFDGSGHIITDGTYFGKHKSYDEAFNACMSEANKAAGDGTVINVKCIPTSVKGEGIF